MQLSILLELKENFKQRYKRILKQGYLYPVGSNKRKAYEQVEIIKRYFNRLIKEKIKYD